MIALPTDKYQSPPPPVSTATSVAAAITPIPMGHKKCKLNEIESVTLLDDDDIQTLYPHLSHTHGGGEDGFDITNPTNLKSMQKVLNELMIFCTNYELKVKDTAKVSHSIHYVRVPITASN